ncbi:ABC transporter ATP-binding protein [Litoreibacter roseus]|uniref:ABC transporter ATP-binding protein n=1 Tax=Litoreibacter roseus TaxID=2601869 RepID=A0A6N6JHT0_9RHOB|nr:ABC transporter ATP-binding protein [Litoreibacter roseus]GFE64959.1 ABC transporter ATP-binding protein [Litoreibacter roseus]
MLTVTNLHKSFDTTEGPLPVLRGISLSLEAGKSLALTGESGSGKSTLLHLIGCLDHPDSGEITLDGERFDTLDDAGRARIRREAIGLVFQQFNLIPSLTVAQNLSFQARLAGRLDQDWQSDLAEKLGLTPFLDRYPEQLSGGQQQRVAVGRALAPRPRLVLADEPTGNLDEATGDAVLDIMLDLVTETGAAFLMVTHSERLAARLDNRIHLAKGTLADDLPVQGIAV